MQWHMLALHTCTGAGRQDSRIEYKYNLQNLSPHTHTHTHNKTKQKKRKEKNKIHHWRAEARGLGTSRFNILRCPAVRTGVGAPASLSLPLYHEPSPVLQCICKSNLIISRWQKTQGTAQPSVPSDLKRTTAMWPPIFLRIQLIVLCAGTPCFLASVIQESNNLQKEPQQTDKNKLS